MNSTRPLATRLLRRGLDRPSARPQRQYSTTPILSAMPPGTPIPGLENIYPPSKDGKESKVPVAKPREEYPGWVSELTTPLPSLAKLRNMKVEDAADKEMKRYLKLVRKATIKQNNLERAKK